MDHSASRPASLLIAALLATLLIAPAPASAAPAGAAAASKHSTEKRRGGSHRKASKRTRHRTGQQSAIGAARVVKQAKLQRRAKARHRTAPVVPAENPAILFRGDFDTGFGDWHVQSIGERATLLSSGALQGTQAARFEVRDGDVEPETGSQRSEVSGPLFDEGQNLYIRDAIRIGSAETFEGPWQIIQQLHEQDWSGSPGMAVLLDEDHALTLGAGDGSTTFWESSPLQTDRWYDLVYRVFLSQDSDDGFVEVWLDGAQQSLDNGEKRIYGKTIQAAQTYIKAGIYRSKSSTGTSVVEHDAIIVGTSLAAVTRG